MQEDRNAQTLNTAISADDVSSYLRSHPHFFEQHASLLTEIFLPSPHGSGAISLAERQQLAQRDKIRVTETMMAQLIAFGEQNDMTSQKVHNFSVKLIENQDFNHLPRLVSESMQQVFAVTQSLVRVWVSPSDATLAQGATFTPVNAAFSDWVSALNTPYCGVKPELAEGLMQDHLQSFAFIPLYQAGDQKQVFGVLMLGSDDAQRFKADMGLMYLNRIGDLVSASFSAYL
ncbi:MAG: DUF484 family protein [Methylotenera sp.]|nr:DUF484 family protein [Methylotenera sp.]MSP99507.1 DUF484 family protein [Methylotenera sp.]